MKSAILIVDKVYVVRRERNIESLNVSQLDIVKLFG